MPTQESNLHEPYTDEQVSLIFGKVIERQDYYLLLFIYFIHYTFSRPGKEVRLMKVGDLKPNAVVIPAQHSKNRRVKSPTLTKPIQELIDFLGVRNYANHFYIFGSEGTPGLIPVGKGCYYHRHKKILDELGIIGKYTLYGWKHSGNIRAIQLGVTDASLQLQNGFTERRTLEIYRRKLSAYYNNEIAEKFV
ncbi:integrase family protein [Fibrella aestuarina BUZ 2]|uniref:Integrase family protein n=1 Tax=Fibrella aestuarina BUZ 2 TaxID=1166018 RepID=I0K6I8_9BACT|nr:integrase family protein [Fibrella aestuarina]CCG99741.1 integrase family protein [Fibrella aestuarina BUZ 2]